MHHRVDSDIAQAIETMLLIRRWCHDSVLLNIPNELMFQIFIVLAH
jgi:hypothetical protein